MDATELRYLTYSRGDICDRTIDTAYLQHECPLDQKSPKTKTLAASSIQNANASLGRFDQLPLETTQNVLSNIDLSTLTLLRSISKRMSLLTDSVLPYRELVTHAPDALRTMLSTGAAHYFTPIHLYNALRAQNCFLCGRFGAYLYLLKCRRCCWQCLSSAQDVLPISKEAAKSLYHLDLQTWADIPTIVNIPRFYGPKQHRKPHMRKKGGVRVALVAYGAARKAAAKVQALTADYEKVKIETRVAFRGPVSQDFMRDMDCMNYDPIGYRKGYGLEPQRFMAAVRFPTLIAGKDGVEWGLSCLGCLERADFREEEKVWNEQYTTKDMVTHLEQCQKAGHLWANDRVRELHKR